MTQLTVTGGSGYAVYEVVDHSPYVAEAVQAPVFIVNPATSCSSPTDATLTVMEAPVSTVSIATMTDPVPRYIAAALGSDCQQTGDCNQVYFPVLSVNTAPISLTGASLGGVQTAPVMLLNNGGSALSYTTSITYQSGSGWLSVTPAAADIATNLTLTAVANPVSLQPGVYIATINVNGGEGGSAAIPVTFTVGSPGVTIQGIVSAASFQVGAPLAPGSYAALFGLNLLGANLSVTFNGLAANLLYEAAGQINLIVPASLSGQTAAAVLVSANGMVSNSFNVALAPNEPGIFTPGIVNSNGTVNSSSNPATRGTFVSVYLTGLATPVTGIVTVNMGSQTGIAPLPGQTYVQPTYPALDQVNVTVPASLTPVGAVPLTVCVTSAPAPQVCSNMVSLYTQ
jgi:uncharacterized protein (TIGR03437 family)